MVSRPTMSPSFAGSPRRGWATTLWAGALVVLALTLLVTSPALAIAPSFTDVPANHPYYAAIGDLASRDIINGKGDGRFYPSDPVTRQQFAKMVVKTLGLTVTGDEVCPFVDVFPGAGTDPFYPVKYVAVCAQNNITKGADATHFNPAANISRQQLITMLVRAAGLSDPPAEYVPSFSAGQFSLVEHYQNARKAAYAGLLDALVGLGPNYNFAASASRGECAQLLYNLLQQGHSGGGGDGTGSITTAPATDAVHVSAGSAGGLFDLGQPGLMEGFQLEVPAGAYSQSVGLDVSFLPITGDTFGPDIDLVSPLIHIDNGGVIADENLALTIPVQVPAGKFATASFYDRANGTLEPLPLLDEGATYITVATRHFSDIVVELDQPSLLQGNATSFSPALDGWQFTNEGTVITPGGECAGMCSAALFYFYTFVADPTRGFQPRAGAARLYGKYDNTGKVSTPTFGNDDSLAIRLSAAVQHDYGGMWDASPGYLWEELVRRDDVTWKNLLVALSRHQPRLIALTGFGPGHEVIAYDAWVGPDGNGELKVADPNHPGEFRKIFCQNGAFVLPDEYSADFRWVRDDGVSALCSFKQVATRWQEFSNKTIGNDLFPTYALKYRNGNASTVLTDGMTISQLPNDKLILDLPVTIVNLNKAPAGTTLTVPRTYAEATLKPGLNQVPVLVEAQGAGKGWVDFQWLSINYSQAPVKPHFTSVNYWDNDPTQGIAFTFEYYEQDGNWVLDGKERHFDGPGRLEEETTWVDGKKSGPRREWFLGCLKVFATYYNDKLEGTYWEYPADGREYYYSWVERQYKDGQEVADSAKSYDRSTPVVCNLSIEIRDGVLDETSLTAYTDSLVTVNFFNNDYPTQHTLSFYSDAAYTQPIFLGRSVTPATEHSWSTSTYFFKAPSTAGTYYFRCDQHPGEKGTFIVR